MVAILNLGKVTQACGFVTSTTARLAVRVCITPHPDSGKSSRTMNLADVGSWIDQEVVRLSLGGVRS
jgi:hypothetical protein